MTTALREHLTPGDMLATGGNGAFPPDLPTTGFGGGTDEPNPGDHALLLLREQVGNVTQTLAELCIDRATEGLLALDMTLPESQQEQSEINWWLADRLRILGIDTATQASDFADILRGTDTEGIDG
jgi:hypothetical protein